MLIQRWTLARREIGGEGAVTGTIPDIYVGMANIHKPEFDETRDREGFRALRARIGRQMGTRDLGASLWEIPPGEAAYPYHYHLAEEELIVVLAGTLRLRTTDGWSTLEEGDIASFPVGEAGGHQVVNGGAETARMLAISTQRPDVVIYPDSGKLGAFERLPQGGGLYKLFRLDDEVDYWRDETPPDRP
jgi:uncharacterized cupin superfamily protein